MLTVTDAAYSRLCEMLADYPDDVAVRIVRRDGHTKMRPGRVHSGDEVFEQKGRVLLLVDRKTAKHVENRSLDLRETDGGPRLRLRPAQKG
jgi:Fe-S cluster assembly iron-binding protein IscA